MSKKKFITAAKKVINLEIRALQKLKNNINSSFNSAVIQSQMPIKSYFMWGW